jgi:hypothetical protein
MIKYKSGGAQHGTLFIRYNSNYYLEFDDYLNNFNFIFEIPSIIYIDNMQFDYLGISHIKKLEYLLNIHNYKNISLIEYPENNMLIYNGYIYKLVKNSCNMLTYHLIDTILSKHNIDKQPKLKIFKSFINTEKQISNFREYIIINNELFKGHEINIIFKYITDVLNKEYETFSCNNVITIPQYKGTCWFNAILMAIFYSQYSRKLLYHHFEGKHDKFSRIMNNIIKHNYIKSEKAIEYFKFMKPENILRYINIENKKDIYKNFKKEKTYGYKFSSIFLPHFLKSLDKNILDVIIYNKNFYANYYSMCSLINNTSDINKWSGISHDPEYIIVNKITGSNDNLYKELFLIDYKYYSDEIEKKLNLKNYNIDITGLLELNDEIYYNGIKYILDSVILSNYNNIKIGHAIAGITCKNIRYVYNGWMRSTDDPNKPANFGNTLLPCELMKFDWDVKKDDKFCLNPNLCKLDTKLDTKDLCFSFNKYNRATLIYVKDTSIKSVDTNLSISSPLTLPSLKTNSSDFSELEFENNAIKTDYIKTRKERKTKQNEYKTKILKK